MDFYAAPPVPTYPQPAWPGARPAPSADRDGEPIRFLGGRPSLFRRPDLRAAALGAALVMLFSSSKLLLIVVGASILAVGYGWRAVRRVLRRGLPPWEAEPHWRGRRRGATVTSRALFVRATMVVAVVLAALGASRSFARGPVEKTSADVALLVVAPVAAFAAWRGFRASALGSTTLTWDRFPLFVGEAAELSFGVGPSGGAFEDVEFTLRCVAAWPGRELNGRPEVAVLHREELRPALADARPAADTFVPLRLRLVDVA